MRSLFASSVFLFLLFAFSFPASAIDGKVFGTVANMTNNKWFANGEVALQTLKNSSITSTQKTKTDKRGSFSFSNLEVSENTSYQISVKYLDVEYSQTVRLSNEMPEQSLTLNVFEKSSDDSQIRVNTHHIIIEPTSGGGEFVDIMEFIILENASLTSYLGGEPMPVSTPYGDRVGLKLSLPEGYESLEFVDNEFQVSSAVKDNTILDSHALKPGETPIVYRYKLKVSEYLDLSRKLTYDTSRIMLMIADAAWHPTSSAFQKGEDANFHGKTYATYEMKELLRSAKIEISLHQGSPESAASSESPSKIDKIGDQKGWLMSTIIAIAAAGAGASFSYALALRRKEKTDKPVKPVKPVKPDRFDRSGRLVKVDIAIGSWAALLSRDELEKLKEVHLEFISRLDDLKKLNRIPESVYEGVRAEEKKKLAAIMMNLEQLGK